MSLWQDIIKIAVIGVERQPLQFGASPEVLQQLVARLDQTDREAALLGAAAAASLYERGGRLPARDLQPLPEACALEDVPACGSQAAQTLRLLLGGERRELLPEWLSALAAINRRVASAQLPALLDHGKRNPSLREAIVTVIGERGRWLASQNEDWKYASAIREQVEADWHTSSFDGRLAFLRRLRGSDPACARALARSTWNEDSPDHRGGFLVAFEINLSLEDEEFLELALTDRSKGVRREAVRMLAMLPQSRFRQKLIARAAPLLSLKKKRAKLSLEVTLPDSTDEEMAAFGISPKPASFSQLGEKAWWLKQLVGLTPPSAWTQALNASADDIIKAVLANDDWRTLLLEALALAVKQHQDRDWIEALFANQSRKGFNLSLSPLLMSLSGELREEFALKMLRTEADAYAVLKSCSYPWGGILSLTALDSLLQSIRKNQVSDQWNWTSLLAHIAVYFNAEQIPEAIAQVSAAMQKQNRPPKCLPKCLDDFIATLQFRQDMLKEINQ
ncbi:MAG TPA: DUF5691 domain-containing protein [Blastocatellia bacterium]|nr:DUF5691 domain-containing protein [Blastocatellia bacterium]HMV81631.1 DUF5691 domain-containing protein [Blastocatellia bacterium]HMX29592.1 DUF5691 domain-containing protein [Blastocatellia bacterium]HMZ17979.1 DUF5691 domain-containing protein [Blastocatellia bacterium]HNG33752.1 DUF5691 domain-containing protein [Blastocatellia bacterium]